MSTCCMTILRPASAYCRMTIVTKSLAASGLAAMLRLNMLVSWLSILPPSICIRQELRALLLQTPSTSSLSVHVCLSVCNYPSASREKEDRTFLFNDPIELIFEIRWPWLKNILLGYPCPPHWLAELGISISLVLTSSIGGSTHQ